MGYFSNGDVFMAYTDEYCQHCINLNGIDEGLTGCPILDIHQRDFDDISGEELQKFRDWCIPRDGITNGECRFFIERPGQ